MILNSSARHQKVLVLLLVLKRRGGDTIYPEVHSAVRQKSLSLIFLDSHQKEDGIPGMNVLIQLMLPRLLGSHDTCPRSLPCPQLSCGSHARAKMTL